MNQTSVSSHTSTDTKEPPYWGWFIVKAGFGIGILIAALCGAFNQPPQPHPTDPRIAWVQVYTDDPNLYERCSGSTLIFKSEGSRDDSVSAVPNSPECN